MTFILRGPSRDAMFVKAQEIVSSLERTAGVVLTFQIDPKDDGWQMTVNPIFTQYNKDLSHAAWRELKQKFSVKESGKQDAVVKRIT